VVHGAAPGLAGDGTLRGDSVHPVLARCDGGGPERGLRPDGEAKGLATRAITIKHGLRAALVPVVTLFGLDVAFLLGGTLFTEQIFQLEGIGKWGLDAVYIKDLPVVQATSLIFAVFVVVMNVVVDIAYSVLDPRVRLA
jgi:peptide/nickel transport system permease protein